MVNQWRSLVLALALTMGCSSHEITKDGGTMTGPININKTGWSHTDTLTTGNTAKVITLQANFPKADLYTVQFGVKAPKAGSPSFGIFEATADIEWAVEGSTIYRRVSVAEGTSISGTGQAVRVRVKDVTVGFDDHDYNVGILVSPGSRAGQRPPILKAQATFEGINAGTSWTVDVPQNVGVSTVAVYLSVLAVGALPVTAIVFQKNGGGQIINQYDPIVNHGFVPLLPGATQVEVMNISGANNYRGQMVFGIDG